jgi:hypothetical protein
MEKRGVFVNKITLAVLLLVSTFAWAGTESNAGDYTVSVHVSSSNVTTGLLQLKVVINGKNFVLSSSAVPGLLALGDYKAKLLKDEHKTAYDSYQVYEFLFPDKKTRKYIVVGQWE